MLHLTSNSHAIGTIAAGMYQDHAVASGQQSLLYQWCFDKLSLRLGGEVWS